MRTTSFSKKLKTGRNPARPGAAKKPAPKRPPSSTAIRSTFTLDSVQINYLKANPSGKMINFNSHVAIGFDIQTAIIFQLMAFWVLENTKTKRNYYDGKYWTFNSASQIREIHPYLSERNIYDAIKKLTHAEILIKASKNYNKHGYDRTSWYTLNEKTIKSMFKTSVEHLITW